MPGLDRRMLERMAVGAPAPSASGPPRAIQRGARVRRGWPFRRIGTVRQKRAAEAPRIAIGQPRPREPASGDLSGEPLYLLIPGDESRRNGTAAALALAAAERLAGDRNAVLIDLDPDFSWLRRDAGAAEGISEVFRFGISISAAGWTTTNRVRILPLGSPPVDPSALYDHDGWTRVVRTARRRGTRLLAYVPADPERLAALAPHAAAALLIATPDEERSLRSNITAAIPVVGVLQPPETADGASDPPQSEPPDQDVPRRDTGEERVPTSAHADVSKPDPEDVAPDVSARGQVEGIQEPTPRYSVPRTSQRRERSIRVTAILILAYWSYYIFWRWTGTLNLDALWFSVPLALAETWAWLTAFLLVFTAWRLNHRTAPPASDGLSVDVFITTYDEPIEVIRRTAISARAVRYPHETYVLDDGGRTELRMMAQELGIGYIAREGNEHAKAGNLNHALGSTSGDFILQLDADHAPLPHILDRLLGFFEDGKVAFVQTPQDFYNIGSFTHDIDPETRRIWEEQKLFFSVIQPGKDCWNSAFFCGSCAVFRRSALDDVGGFSTDSITEDIETSLRLHARGWKSVYFGENLAYGLSPVSAAAFHIQHSRWAQGAMQVLRRYNPISYPGLSLPQRLGYFYSLSGYFIGVQKLIFYLAPVVFFMTGVLPIRALDTEFLLRFVPYLVLSIGAMELLARGLGFTWIAERYHMAKFWTYTRAVPTLFSRRPRRFHVTPKGRGRVPVSAYAPQLALLILIVGAVYWAIFAEAYEWLDYGGRGRGSLAFQLNFAWAAVNFVLAADVVRLSAGSEQRRRDHRFIDRLPIHVRATRSPGESGGSQLGLVENLNASGIGFRSVSRFSTGTELDISLPLATGEVRVPGRVTHIHPADGHEVQVYMHGVVLTDLTPEARESIEIHCAQHAAPLGLMQYRTTERSFWSRLRRRPGDEGVEIALPARIRTSIENELGSVAAEVGVLERLGRDAATLIMSGPVPPETPLEFEVPGSQIHRHGRTIFSHAWQTPIGTRHVIGVRTEPNPHPAPGRSTRLRTAPIG
ncbi:MAG: glycosyltransferase family 2 protein [Gemmatimonadota bacterium]